MKLRQVIPKLTRNTPKTDTKEANSVYSLTSFRLRHKFSGFFGSHLQYEHIG